MDNKINCFKKKIATRISILSLLIAIILSPIAWYVSLERAEENIVGFAVEESKKLLANNHFFVGDASQAEINSVVKSLTGDLFDIAEVYDASGNKLAASSTRLGEEMESLLPKHNRPSNNNSKYEKYSLPNNQHVMSVFVPLRNNNEIIGYFEGVRFIPAWQDKLVTEDAVESSLMVCLAALICGLVLYPIMIRLFRENQIKTTKILESHISLMESLGRSVAKRDSDTGDHNYRVAWYASKLGAAMGLNNEALESLIAGSFLHDVGKIGIGDAILLKPGKLTDSEMDIMRTHVTIGEEIVSGIDWLKGAAEVVAGHHEKWDGTGYPRQLSQTAIPLSARIFAVVDVFDALTSDRPYKKAFSLETALGIIKESTGTHFDPTVVGVFTDMAEDLYAFARSNNARIADEIMSQFLIVANAQGNS